MAIVKLPLLSEQAKGSFGENLVFKRSRGMNIVSRRPDASGRIATPRQMKVRSILAELASSQTALTQEQLDGWNNLTDYKPASTFGLPVPKSAINSFIQINFFRRDRELAANMSAPFTAMKGNISNFSVTNKAGSPGTVTITWTLPSGAAVADAVNIWVGGPLDSLSRRVQPSDFKHYSYTAGNLTTLEIPDLVSGKYYFFRARFVMSDGRVESFLQSASLQIA